jgi:hypothetical protein
MTNVITEKRAYVTSVDFTNKTTTTANAIYKLHRIYNNITVLMQSAYAGERNSDSG